MAVDTAKRLYGPTTLAAAAADTYTVPASTTAIIRSIILTNGDTAARTFTLSIGADAAGTRLYDAVSIAANTTLYVPTFIVLTATQKIQAFADTANKVNLTLNGIETA